MKQLFLFTLLFTANLTYSQTCINFQDTTLSDTSTTTSYGTPFYSNSGIDFRLKFVAGGLIPPIVGVTIDSSTSWNAYNSNFSGNLMWLGENYVQIDFSNLPYANKKITFDISYSSSPIGANPFNVNGAGLTSLPTGVAYTYTALSAGIHVEITGPINTIEIRGFEVAFDNLCVEQLLLNGIKETSNTNNITVYPNPTQNSIFITSKEKIEKIVLLDISGSIVQQEIKPANNQFDLSKFKSGTYFIQIYMDNKIISRKIIKLN